MNPWYAVALLWLITGVLLATHLIERRSEDQRHIDKLARDDRRRR